MPSGISGFLAVASRAMNAASSAAEMPLSEQRLAVAPAVLGGRLDDRVDAEHQRARDQDGAGDVRTAAEADPLVALDEPQGEHGGHDRDRHVDEEDPVPVDRLGEDPAGEQPDRPAARRDEGVDPDRLRLLPRLREHRDDHPQDHGRGHRAAHALYEARAHEHPLALREPAQKRCGREQREAREEDVAAPQQVAEAPRQEQQAPERDQVRVDRPSQARVREPEVVLDVGQRDVHDGHVENDHQHARAEHVEGQPAVSVGLGSHGSTTRSTPQINRSGSCGRRARALLARGAVLQVWPGSLPPSSSSPC